MKTFQQLLRELNACQDARMWARGKTIEQVVEKCHRGDWLLWLAQRVDIGLQPLTLAKGHCVNTVRHLMKDERSIKAVDTAIAFGAGGATRDKLDAYAAASKAAYYAAYYVEPDDAANAIAADAAAADDAANAAVSAAGAYAANAAIAAPNAYDAYAAANAARKQNQKQTADICREHIGQLIIDKVNELLKN